MSKYHSSKEVLEVIGKVQFLTNLNLATYLKPDTPVKKDTGALDWLNILKSYSNSPTQRLRRLQKHGLIREIPNTNDYIFKTQKYRFYGLTDNGFKAIEQERKYLERRSVDLVQHEHGKIDIALAFLWNFPEFEIDIRYPGSKDSLDGYKPDMIVTMTHRETGKAYDFIVEFERSKRQGDTIKNKIEKQKKLKDLRKYGLSSKTQFLYITAITEWDTFWRPIEFDRPEVRRVMRMSDKYLKGLLSRVSDLPPHQFRFKTLHSVFTDFNKWHDTQGDIKPLINQ